MSWVADKIFSRKKFTQDNYPAMTPYSSTFFRFQIFLGNPWKNASSWKMLHSGIPYNYICRTVKFYDVQDKMVQWNKSGEGDSGYFLDCAENVVALDAAVDLIMLRVLLLRVLFCCSCCWYRCGVCHCCITLGDLCNYGYLYCMVWLMLLWVL